MPYPNSPFNDSFPINTIFDGRKNRVDKVNVEQLLRWLCNAPRITSYKVNTLLANADDVSSIINKRIASIARNRTVPLVYVHPHVPDTIILNGWTECEQYLQKYSNEVIVDVNCGAAVLRGAHVFAPAVMGMLSGTKVDDFVSIYADVSKKCKQGLQKFYACPHKVFVGNGAVKMIRRDLFGPNLKPKGVAIEVVDAISGCPSVGDVFLPKGHALLQNIPSILCVNIFNPQPNDVVLDMCASPGHKTTHIAALMQNKGTLIAIDKSPSRIEKLKSHCQDFAANVLIFQADSTKILSDKDVGKDNINPACGPPFPAEFFDKILLDAPCSGLGQRPQLNNNITEKILRSYVYLQRKLFYSAVDLLKTNGVLVYSTCTITAAENELIVAWALETFKCLRLIKIEPSLGGIGLSGCGLSEENQMYVQRFGPTDPIDSVGFFIAKFVKS